MPRLHPLPSHRPCGAKCKSKKRGFCFCGKLFSTHSPFSREPWVCENRVPENRSVREHCEIFGKRRSGARKRALPSGRCENAADCSDEGALRQKCHFATRIQIIANAKGKSVVFAFAGNYLARVHPFSGKSQVCDKLGRLRKV